MIAKLIVYKCRNCDSQNIVKNGHNASGSQQYVCKDCGKRGVLKPKRGDTEAQKAQILSASHERSSMRGVQPTFGVSRPTLVSWLKKTKPTRNLKTNFCLPNPKMYWKPMKCGHLFMNDGTNAGSGRSCVGELAKSWHLSSVIAVRQPAVHFGNRFHRLSGLPKLQRFLGSLSTCFS
jgi:transposase-like protein